MADLYYHWRREEPEGILDLSEFERRLFAALGQEDTNYIYQFKLFLAEATEHIAVQLVPLYRRIVLAMDPEQLTDLTQHRRFLVRTAAAQKIDYLEGRPLRIEKVILNPPRWPQNAWNFGRHRASGNPGP